MTFKLDILPKATPRPRFGSDGAHNTKDYLQYKKTLMWLIKIARIPTGDYSNVNLVFMFPYPKKTSKVKMIDGAPHRKKPDVDNLAKGILDALTKTGVFKDDAQISGCSVKKIYSIEKPGIIIELA